MRGASSSNAAMVEELARSGNLKSQECRAAFEAVDRRHFWTVEDASIAYMDMPMRHGRLHLSAPHIYAKALESLLPLERGMSFLNVGSGTGYFNSIVSHLIGDQSANHGVEIWPETVDHAKQRCKLIGKEHIEFTIGNVYQLDVHFTMRYDRIYLGACANSRSKYLYRLLEVGGILIGPFQVGHHQQLRRVVRQSEKVFQVEVLGAVQFASLVEPPQIRPPRSQPASDTDEASAEDVSGTSTPSANTDDGANTIGLPGVPFAFSLQERAWTQERCWLYPSSFKQVVVATALLSRVRDPNLPCLPPETWIKHIFPLCSRRWFEVQPPAASKQLPQSLPDQVPTFELPPNSKSCSDEEGDERWDDKASTRPPSSCIASAQSTPESGPSLPPADFAPMDVDLIEESGELLFEVFPNGIRHAIGTQGDPDDGGHAEEPVNPRLVMPLRVLQMLAEEARTRRRQRSWEDVDEVLEDEEDAIFNHVASEVEEGMEESSQGDWSADEEDEDETMGAEAFSDAFASGQHDPVELEF